MEAIAPQSIQFPQAHHHLIQSQSDGVVGMLALAIGHFAERHPVAHLDARRDHSREPAHSRQAASLDRPGE